MKAAVLIEAGKPLQIEQINIANPGPHEVLIRTAACGLCHSDLHFIEGTYPHPLPAIPGHEAAGIVEAVGSEVRTVKVGDAVVTCLSAFCGHCEYCVTGRMSLCLGGETRRRPSEAPRLTRPDGSIVNQMLNLSAYAEMMLVHEHACVAIHPDMPLPQASVIGCAVTTGAGTIFNACKVTPGETVAVIGCGGVGLATINAAKIAGAGRIIAADPLPEKRAMALKLGATDVVDALADDAAAQIQELTKGGVDHAIEAVGRPASGTLAVKSLKRGGTATILGMMPLQHSVGLSAMDLLSGKKLQGAIMGGNRFPVDIPRLVDFYMRGLLDLDTIISETIPLERINEGFDQMKRGDSARSVIVFDQ
ncbi:AdhC Zn-dependent alcohol dehydrogenases, class III [Sphingomonadaceae bacterium]|uniref:Zn-dependent alcohol dehydrogenase n=1 Tax=Sphingorhabdus sp. TaxID=1902408 RepID=UPI00273FF357|nr:Zn-dependent alcohol dehydrogenase [Sphingorhabdus sp.]MCF8493223.1 Zn-dependent alcohol dehydrogenase [Sphingomonadaceae bacterium]MCF8497682.1 Zn-dependent alcohol dehydrogenase [Sphingomonadaceae bacterium]MDP4757397.1 Zn-dependent alcohol dehydrogenase [Sphingorhabdus sp.]MDP4872691.1 Zn-dependent alcohol dehydrogenase [Sphingorhabdus sp.]MDP4927480.1 Zn-dependent alcohol dehydrogenase [Sphingorhabdus sp.]